MNKNNIIDFLQTRWKRLIFITLHFIITATLLAAIGAASMDRALGEDKMGISDTELTAVFIILNIFLFPIGYLCYIIHWINGTLALPVLIANSISLGFTPIWIKKLKETSNNRVETNRG
ncbi:hypothetical protein JIN85_13545 [Luteolibacter pohnpeiensis]|uniref:Uncharacterized protein n=1 Tax=Luteolibacter pohnpeiensis TaxID=454153 RepID=A0A934VWM8_9BACT|nr:hypothetical protein [Luteolibacter pohnpeiensis]MBK1883445.1 hypothetical protein [Luteolibacter pohnpeiensis]